MSVVTPSWKLAYFPEQDEGRLWDRIADPEEQHDLWAVTAVENPAVATARTGLLKALLRWRAQQDALGFMAMNLGGSGPSAQHVIEHTTGLRGIDAEQRLQQMPPPPPQRPPAPPSPCRRGRRWLSTRPRTCW